MHDIRRYLVLPRQGQVLINTDIHGNLEDFERLKTIFKELPDDTHWAILGDTVHGPSDAARKRRPDLYDYEDQSFEIVRRIHELQQECRDRVHYVLGNHDWAHVGGPRTRKFYPDEAENLEQHLNLSERTILHTVFNEALLCILTPCGAFLSHGVPGTQLEELDEIDAIQDFEFARHNPRHTQILEALMTAYGQPEPVLEAFLQTVSDFGVEQRFVIHGHDRDEEGFFTDGPYDACPVIFGAPRANKRYIVLNLEHSYQSTADLRLDEEVRHLYP